MAILSLSVYLMGESYLEYGLFDVITSLRGDLDLLLVYLLMKGFLDRLGYSLISMFPILLLILILQI